METAQESQHGCFEEMFSYTCFFPHPYAMAPCLGCLFIVPKRGQGVSMNACGSWCCFACWREGRGSTRGKSVFQSLILFLNDLHPATNSRSCHRYDASCSSKGQALPKTWRPKPKSSASPAFWPLDQFVWQAQVAPKSAKSVFCFFQRYAAPKTSLRIGLGWTGVFRV